MVIILHIVCRCIYIVYVQVSHVEYNIARFYVASRLSIAPCHAMGSDLNINYESISAYDVKYYNNNNVEEQVACCEGGSDI